MGTYFYVLLADKFW